MAGHSKWANIKHKKGRADAKKGKAFSRAAKEIITAVKLGGPDPAANPRLRLAVDKARAVNFPSDSIERNIKKASSDDQSGYEEVTYELYGHGGVGLMVEGMTDNRNRFASEIRIATNKRGGNVANPGAVAYNFERKGVLEIEKGGPTEDDLFMAVTDAGAEDFEDGNEIWVAVTPPDQLFEVKQAVEAIGGKCLEAELRYLAKTTVECDEETLKANQALIEWLEEIDDVDAIHHNIA